MAVSLSAIYNVEEVHCDIIQKNIIRLRLFPIMEDMVKDEHNKWHMFFW